MRNIQRTVTTMSQGSSDFESLSTHAQSSSTDGDSSDNFPMIPRLDQPRILPTGIEQWNNRMKMRNKKVTLAAHTTRFSSAEQNFLKSLDNFDMNFEDQNNEPTTRAPVESDKNGDDDDSDGPTTPSPVVNPVRAQFNLNNNRKVIDNMPKVAPLNSDDDSNRQMLPTFPTSNMVPPQVIGSGILPKTDSEKTETNSDSDDENKKEGGKTDDSQKESSKPEVIKQKNILPEIIEPENIVPKVIQQGNIQPAVIQTENIQPEVIQPLNLPIPPLINEPKEDKKETNDDSSEVKSNKDNFQKIFGDKDDTNNKAKTDDETLTLSDLFSTNTNQRLPTETKTEDKDDKDDKNEDDKNKKIQGKLVVPDITGIKEVETQVEEKEDKSNDDAGVIKLSDIFDSKSEPKIKTDDMPTIERDDDNQPKKVKVENERKDEDDSKKSTSVFGGLFEQLASISSNEPENNDDDNTSQTESVAEVIKETIEDVMNTDDNNDDTSTIQGATGDSDDSNIADVIGEIVDNTETNDNNDAIIQNTGNVPNTETTDEDDDGLPDVFSDDRAEPEVPGVSFIGQANNVPPPPPAVFTSTDDADDDSENPLETLSERVEDIIEAIAENETDDDSSRDDNGGITEAEDVGNDADVFDVDSDSGPPSVPDLIESILDDTSDNSAINTDDDRRDDNELPKEAASDGAETRISDTADLDDLEELSDFGFGGIGIEPTVLRQDIPPEDRVQHIPQRPINDFSNMIARRKAKMKLSKCKKKLPSVCFSYPVSLDKKGE